MKKFLLFSVIALLVGCVDYTDDINAIDERLDALEQSVPSIEEQISAIQTSIKALEEVDKSLDESIKALEASDKATAEEIAALKEADKAIEAKIEELKKYIDDVLRSTKDWVIATFATLEQLYALSSEVATLKSLVDANKAEAAANLANAIANFETSLKTWVGEQLSNYYTIAEIDAKIATLEKAIADGDAALQQQLNDLKSQLETTKSEVTEAYKKAIKEAIETNNGVINAKIAEEIGKVNGLIEELNSKLAKLQIQVDNNTEDIAKLLARIQSVSYVPQYSDGKATVKYVGTKESSEVTLDFKVSPKECVAELANVWKKAVKVESIYTQTRAVSFVDMPVQYFEADEATGVITIVASGKNLSDNFFAGTQSASVALVISDGNNSVTTDYIPMVVQEITNEIWYTSTDGNIVTPYATDVFGANIVSNIYKNGKGVILFDAPITLIGQKAFLRCSSLTRIEIPSSVTSIGAYAFGYCSKLMSLTIPDSVTSIGNSAFYGCTILKTTTIPNSVIEIGNKAFYACWNFQSVTIPNSATKLGTAAFSLCSSAKAFYGKFASTDNRCLIVNGTLNSFAPCGLTEYTIPDGITEIGELSFPYCTHLQSVTIPDSVTSIGEKAFLNCTSLIKVYCAAKTPPKGDSNMFSYFDADDNLYPIGCKIYVPALSVEAYKSASYWSSYASYIVGYDF